MRKYETYLAFFMILFLGILFHSRYINDFPTHKHAWAQSDRYALSLGFVNNGLNFFKPETFVLNNQFGAETGPAYETSITAVDFPIHDYIPAIFMKLSGSNAPWIFRLYIILYSCIGLFALFKLSYFLSGHYIKSLLVVIFAATSPVFVYYQGSFLPTIPSLSNAIIGIYFYAKYLYEEKNIRFNLSIIFITLAALSRTTFVIPLVAVFSFELLRILMKESRLKPKIVPVALSIIIFGFYYFYNDHLREIYGSVFLSQLKPADNFQETIEIFKSVIKTWGTQYFSRIHYLVLLLLTLAVLYFLIYKKKSPDKRLLRIGFLVLIIFIGCIMFAAVMIHQYKAHDYYFLDTFFLPVILLIIFLLAWLPGLNFFKSKILNYSLLGIACLFLIINASLSQKRTHTSGHWNRTDTTVKNYSGSEVFLDSLGISKDSKMLVIDAYAPNIPLILMDRKGFAVMSTKKEKIVEGLMFNHDFIVLQNEFFLSDIYTTYPEILLRMEKIADNGKISVCRIHGDTIEQTLFGFLGLDGSLPVFTTSVSYDQEADKYWQHAESTIDTSISASSIGHLRPEMQYGLTYKTKDLPFLRNNSHVLLLSSQCYQDSLSDCDIVVSLSENGKNIYYKSYNLQSILQNENKWEEVKLLFQLPRLAGKDYEFAVYLWNTGKSDLYTDDFTLNFY